LYPQRQPYQLTELGGVRSKLLTVLAGIPSSFRRIEQNGHFGFSDSGILSAARQVAIDQSGRRNEVLLMILLMTCISFLFLRLWPTDDMMESENETLRERVATLEKKIFDQNDEIVCLRSTLADVLRRLNQIEAFRGNLSMS
jgi:hypothetical protein